MDTIKIYADGACRNNNKAGRQLGAYGVVLLFKDYKKELKGTFKLTTNNRMEIMSVIKGLRALKRTDLPIEVYSDSQYVINTMTQNWKKKINLDYWVELDHELFRFKNTDITWIKVKGHSDNEYNNRADELANEAMDEYQNKHIGG